MIVIAAFIIGLSTILGTTALDDSGRKPKVEREVKKLAKEREYDRLKCVSESEGGSYDECK